MTSYKIGWFLKPPSPSVIILYPEPHSLMNSHKDQRPAKILDLWNFWFFFNFHKTKLPLLRILFQLNQLDRHICVSLFWHCSILTCILKSGRKRIDKKYCSVTKHAICQKTFVFISWPTFIYCMLSVNFCQNVFSKYKSLAIIFKFKFASL